MKKTREMTSPGLRTCVACRKKDAPDALVRFTVGDGIVSCVVPGSRQMGRGMSLCPNHFCFQKALKSRKSRFHASAGEMVDPLDAGKLLDLAARSYEKRVHLLRRSGGVGQADSLDPVLAQLHHALLTLRSCSAGETHVR